MALSQDPNLRLRVGSHACRDCTIVVPVGELDLSTATLLREVLGACSGDVVIDLGGVVLIDSSAIGVLVAQRKRLVATGGSLLLRWPRPWPRTVLETVGLADWIAD